jgi:Phage integrase family
MPWNLLGKGNKPAMIPLVPRTARTIDLAVGERCQGPILRRQDNQRLDRRTAHRWVRLIGKRAGLGIVHPHMLRAAFIMAALDAGVPLRDVQLAARHADPAPQLSTTVDVRTSTATPPTSSLPSSPAADQHDADRHLGDMSSAATRSGTARDCRRRPELPFRTQRGGSLVAPQCERVGDHAAVSDSDMPRAWIMPIVVGNRTRPARQHRVLGRALPTRRGGSG